MTVKKIILFSIVALLAGLAWTTTAITQDNTETSRLTVQVDTGEHRIAPEIYGHFAEHVGHFMYEGFWVGPDSDIPNVRGIRTDAVEALKKMKVAVLRWPGGCFADEYHWKEGVGPREERGKMINTHWGRVLTSEKITDHNTFENPEVVKPAALTGAKVDDSLVTATIPAKSVVILAVN